MSWQVSRQGDQYRIWSTISDAWLTDWISRTEAIAFYYELTLYQFKKKIIEEYLSFPHHWGDYDSRKMAVIVDKERNEQYCQWLHELSKKRDDEYYQFIDEAFEKVMAEIGVGNEKTIQSRSER